MTRKFLPFLCFLLLPVLAWADQPQLEALEAIANTDTKTLTIHGRNFDNGAGLEVTLGGVAILPISASTTTEIEVQLPAEILPGTYTVVISTGGGTIRLDEIDVTLGAVGEQGPQGEPGVPGIDGNDGTNGSDGTSCTVVAVAGGARIDCGAQHALISNGANGTNGAQGPQGEPGPPGPEGPMGPAGSAVIGCDFENRIKAALPSFILSEGCDDGGGGGPPPNPDPAVGIFVSFVGSDNNPGTKESPVQTVSKGIELAAALGADRNVNLLGASPYYEAETINLPDGVNIIGGYNADWTDHCCMYSVINVFDPIGLVADGLTSPTNIQGVDIQPTNADEYGQSSYGLISRNTSALTIERSKIRAGSTVNGLRGTDGSGFSPVGANGTSGANGCEDSAFLCQSCSRPQPGTGATSGANRGGDGGIPGHGSGSGSAGASGAGSGAGFGGAGGDSSTNGQLGAHGLPGTNGSMGASGTGIYSAFYTPINGAAGGSGGPGAGGGGGGGGGGGTANCDSYGGAGGGGGSGGSGGSGGTGGTSAGGSFALYLWDSTVQIESSELITGNGGDGGSGGAGSSGGAGGTGGSGGFGEDDSGAGGSGGNGGDGGDGGYGGGGAGGPSIGILIGGTSSVNESANTFDLGSGGGGGTSNGNSGPNGVRANTYVP